MQTQQAMKMDAAETTRVELVDNWHARWNSVLDSIDEQGQRPSLKVDADGWLSARQVLLVAFNDDQVAGHVCFGIQPMANGKGTRAVTAAVNAFGVNPGFHQAEVEQLLRQAAMTRAMELNCRELVWQ